MSEIDELAKEKAIKLGMPPDVHIPIGARNIESVIKYIGPVKGIESVNEENAFLLHRISLRNRIRNYPCGNLENHLFCIAKNKYGCMWIINITDRHIY